MTEIQGILNVLFFFLMQVSFLKIIQRPRHRCKNKNLTVGHDSRLESQIYI